MQVTVGGRDGARSVQVDNRSSEPIVVSSVTLVRCQNVRDRCGQTTVEATVRAQSRSEVLRVEPADRGKPMSFGVSYVWHRARAVADSTAAGSPAPVSMLNGDGDLSHDMVISLGRGVVALRADPDTIVMSRGSFMLVSQFRVLAIGPKGETIGRVRGDMMVGIDPGTAAILVKPDSIKAVATGTRAFTLRMPPRLSTGRDRPFRDLKVVIVVPE